MERGARYRAYAQLRESKLLIKNHQTQLLLQSQRKLPIPSSAPSPAVKKHVRSQAGGKGSSSSVLPNFTAALRKENRKPATKLSSPPQQKGKNLRAAAEKKGGRKTFASIQERKLLSSAAANAGNGHNSCRRNKSALR